MGGARAERVWSMEGPCDVRGTASWSCPPPGAERGKNVARLSVHPFHCEMHGSNSFKSKFECEISCTSNSATHGLSLLAMVGRVDAL